jgi:hypothetical protein
VSKYAEIVAVPFISAEVLPVDALKKRCDCRTSSRPESLASKEISRMKSCILSPVELISSRPTAPFTIFHRTVSADGGYTCETCGTRRHGAFPHLSDLFAIASQHLNLCRGSVRNRPVEGLAILDGVTHGVVLRDGVMILALHSVFGNTPGAVRVFA